MTFQSKTYSAPNGLRSMVILRLYPAHPMSLDSAFKDWIHAVDWALKDIDPIGVTKIPPEAIFLRGNQNGVYFETTIQGLTEETADKLRTAGWKAGK